jgi:hypothetical protein
MTNDQYDQLLRICKRPGMYVGVADYDQVCAYLDGLHAATGCLTGFGEWLIVRVGTGDNLMWVRSTAQLIATGCQHRSKS